MNTLHFQLPGVKGEVLSPENFSGAKGLIVVFTCNHCPHAMRYEQRLIALSNAFAPKGWPLVAINPNDASQYPQDSFENMKVRAADRKFPFPYLYDETQEVAHAWGATRTPHAFVAVFAPGGLKVIYQGAIDDNSERPDAVIRRYISEAIGEYEAGLEISQPQVPPVGCSVKWKK